MGWKERIDFATESHDALNRLLDTREEHQADAHETYFTANGENYRIRIERIPREVVQEHGCPPPPETPPALELW